MMTGRRVLVGLVATVLETGLVGIAPAWASEIVEVAAWDGVGGLKAVFDDAAVPVRTVLLTADINVADGSLTVPSGGTRTIDLMGHALTITSASSETPAIRVEGSSALTIQDSTGDGALVASGSESGAGIGGGIARSGGSVTVRSGSVTAYGGDFGAGIGGGDGGDGGTVTVWGGSVTAISSRFAAGVGGGWAGDGGTVTVWGGSVTATGAYYGAGIGGGIAGAGGTVTVWGGSVTAAGGQFGAGIGGGNTGAGGTVTVANGTVTATGGWGAAGIGGGAQNTVPGSLVVEAAVLAGSTGSTGSAGDDSVAPVITWSPAGLSARVDTARVETAGTVSITLATGVLPQINSSSLRQAHAGMAYSATLATVGDPAPTLSVTDGTLPEGLSLNPTTGSVTGTPRTPGSYPVQLTASNTILGLTQSHSVLLTVEVDDLSPVAVSTTSLPDGVAGIAYATMIETTGKPAPTYAVTGGALPDGLSLNPATGAISGTPTRTGTSAVEVTATNMIDDHVYTQVVRYAVAINGLPAITTAMLPNGVVGKPYSATIDAYGVPDPTFTVIEGSLPNGLALNPAKGTIEGTPTTAGTFPVTVSASNAAGAVSASFAIQVMSAPVLTGPASLPAGSVGTRYRATISASGTPAPAFAVTRGSLPGGLVLDPVTGAISGTPSQAGSFRVTISASNRGGTSSAELTLVVEAPSIAVHRDGSRLSVSGAGFTPGETISLVLTSDPVVLGSVTADAAGAFATVVTLPTGIAGAKHTLTAVGASSNTPATATVVMSPALAITGGDLLGPLVVGLVLASTGAGLLVWRRRALA